MLRKEAQCRDLQQRLENGEGSKFICVYAIKKNSGIPDFPKVTYTFEARFRNYGVGFKKKCHCPENKLFLCFFCYFFSISFF